MVEVRDVEIEAELRRQLAQQEQEGDGVGAPGDRDDDGSGREKVVLTHEREDGRADRASGRQRWLGRDLNPGPEAYESSALPLSYPAGEVKSTGASGCAPLPGVSGTRLRSFGASARCIDDRREGCSRSGLSHHVKAPHDDPAPTWRSRRSTRIGLRGRERARSTLSR